MFFGLFQTQAWQILVALLKLSVVLLMLVVLIDEYRWKRIREREEREWKRMQDEESDGTAELDEDTDEADLDQTNVTKDPHTYEI